MPDIPCIDALRDCDCSEDTPFKNLSAEAPDLPTFLSTYYGKVVPPLGMDWTVLTCAGLCESTTSQEAADLCAQRAAFLCVTDPWRSDGGGNTPAVPPPTRTIGRNRVPRFFNREQSATVNCPDGLPFTFTVPAGTFVALNQLEADEMAQTYALQKAQTHIICLSNLPASACADTAFSQAITATGSFVSAGGLFDFWSIVAGALPPGLAFDDFGFVIGGTVTLAGTPTVAGVYNFTVQIQTPNGDFMVKPYTLKVMGITNGQPFPDAQAGTAYSQPITSAGVTNPIYSLEAGALPAGLSLDSLGLIFGTPTTAGTSTFTLGVTEAGTGITCDQICEITVKSPCVVPTTTIGFNYGPPTTFPVGHTGQAYPIIGITAPTLTNPSYVIDSGALPPGLNLQLFFGIWIVFGVPTLVGTYNFVIRATGNEGTCTTPFTINIAAAAFPWALTWPPPLIAGVPPGTESHSFNAASFSINATGLADVCQSDFCTGGGHQLYTGVATFANMNIVVTNPTGSIWSIAVFQNGVQIGGADYTLGEGNFNVPIGFGGGTNSPIKVCPVRGSDTNPASHTVLTVTLT